MPEAVIVSTARTPIGRAAKGSLTEMRPDNLGVLAVRAAVGKIPELPADLIEDLILGCAQPAGESDYNLGRVVALLAGLPGVPGTTVNRYCSSSLQATRCLAEEALANGFWKRDIAPVRLADGTLVTQDDGPRAGVTLESVSQLKPVFRPEGTVTAGNAAASTTVLPRGW